MFGSGFSLILLISKIVYFAAERFPKNSN